MVEVKVRKIKHNPVLTKTYLKFRWTCTQCKYDIYSDVVESTLDQYKIRNLGPMRVNRVCSNCGEKHSMELSL